MKQILFLLIFFGLTNVFAKQETCYSVQLASSYAPFAKKNIPEGAKVLHIGNVYTLRYGCHEHFAEAKRDLEQLRSSYPHAMITSTYTWRFGVKKAQKPQKTETPKKTAALLQDLPASMETDEHGSTLEISGPKCYSVQLFSLSQITRKSTYPSGTIILHNAGFDKALYGCYEKIEEAKTMLYKMRRRYPHAIIVAVAKSILRPQTHLGEIRKKGEKNRVLPQKNRALKQRSKPTQELFLLPAVREGNVSTTATGCPKTIEQNIVACRSRCKNSDLQSRWERVDIDAVNRYVVSRLAHADYLREFEASGIRLQSTPSKNSLEPIKTYEDFFRFYITATVDVKKGQTDINNSKLDTESLVLGPGLQYLHNFSPKWYFYTDDRLIFSINKSNTNLKLDIKDFYISSRNLFENRANFLIGRKYLKDKRGWYYKTSLDTLGVSNKHDLLLYELYLGTRLNKNTMAYDPNEIQTNLKGVKFLFGHLSYEFLKQNTLEGFYIYEDNKNAQRKLGWIGLRVQGELPQANEDAISYWVDVASMHGKYQSKAASGLGYDFGGKYYFTRYSAGIAASLAYGSGGGSLYLQPSFTNNRSNYLSKDVSYRYYGEFLQPELSNMRIATLNALYHFNNDTNKTAILALHNYAQDKASKGQYNATNKTVAPNGKSTDIGNEIDLILHYDLFANSYWRFSFGYFLGGSAYNKKTGKKDGFNAQLYYRYIW